MKINNGKLKYEIKDTNSDLYIFICKTKLNKKATLLFWISNEGAGGKYPYVLCLENCIVDSLDDLYIEYDTDNYIDLYYIYCDENEYEIVDIIPFNNIEIRKNN